MRKSLDFLFNLCPDVLDVKRLNFFEKGIDILELMRYNLDTTRERRKKMGKWNICLFDETEYEIEAKTKEEAVEIALDYWAERLPMVMQCDKIEEEK